MKDSSDTPSSCKPLFFLLLCIALPYLTGITHPFVYDDHGAIVENAFLSNSSRILYTLRGSTLSDPHVIDGRRPLLILTYFIDRAIWCLSPFGYHLINLFLHLACSALLFSLVRKMGKMVSVPNNSLGTDTYTAFAAGLVFGLHPVLSEAVQLPAFREDLLCGLFVLLYLRLCLSPKEKVWPWANVALIAALLSKESAAIAPFLLFVLKLIFPTFKLPRPHHFLGLLIVVCFCFVWSLHPSIQALTGTWNGLSLQFPDNLFTAPWLWILWLRLFVFPHPLLADYRIDPVVSPADWQFIIGVTGLILCLCGGWVYRRRLPAVAAGIWWMLLCFLPASNIVPLFNPFAERYLYLAAPGFAWCLAALWSRMPGRKPASLLLALLVALYATQTIRRLRDWRDDLTLWTHTLTDNPKSARAWVWVGLNVKQQGDSRTARAYFERAAQLNEHDASGLVNLAVLAGEQGDFILAEQLAREAIERQPASFQAHWNLALALLEQTRQPEAMEHLRKTLRLNPYFTPPYKALMVLFLSQGNADEARRVETVLRRIDPSSADRLYDISP